MGVTLRELIWHKNYLSNLYTINLFQNSCYGKAKKSAKKSAKKGAKKSSGKREPIAPRGDERYIRIDERGRIKESDDQSKSLDQDRRRKAKTKAKPGQGDKGDR